MAESARSRLDAIDIRILKALQEDGRITVQELAEKVGLTASPCLRRMRMLEEAGVIRGYLARIDPAAVDLSVNVFASIKLERQHQDELERFSKAIAQWPEVLECYLMTGQRDYLMRIVVPDLPAYERFLKDKLTRLSCVASIESSFALGQVKHTHFLPLG